MYAESPSRYQPSRIVAYLVRIGIQGAKVTGCYRSLEWHVLRQEHSYTQGSGDNIKARGGNEGGACQKLPIYSIEGLESNLLDRRCFGADEAKYFRRATIIVESQDCHPFQPVSTRLPPAYPPQTT